jgi:hypothetical protein
MPRARQARVPGLVVAVAGLLAACAAPSPSPSPAGPSAEGSSATEIPSPVIEARRDEQLQALIDGWTIDNDPVGVSAAALYADGDLWFGFRSRDRL